MHWPSSGLTEGATTSMREEESLALIEGGGEADVHRRSSSFEAEDEKETTTLRQSRGWGELFSQWRDQISKTFLHSADSTPLPHTERFFRHARAYIYAFLVFLLPSFLTGAEQQHPNGNGRLPKGAPSSPTAYLDGVRGVAAFVVYIFHYGYCWFPDLRRGYGSQESKDWFWQLPIVRVLHSGRSSVTIFFVLSGYVVTAKTVSMIHANKPDQALHSLSGALFRRPFRLYLPIIASTLVALTLVRLDVFPPNNKFAPPPRANNLREQLNHWYEHTIHLINPFRLISGRIGLYSPPYDGHLWTIPIEFKGSLTVFCLLLAFARTRRWLRLMGEFAAGCWLTQLGHSDMALFCAGLLLAEIALIIPPTKTDLSLSSSSSSPESSSSSSTLQRWRQWQSGGSLTRGVLLRHAWTITLFVLSLHLLSYPEVGGFESVGFRTISRHVPGFYAPYEERIQQFWTSIGAIIFIISLMYSPPVSYVPGAALIARVTASIKRSIKKVVRYVSTTLDSRFSLSTSSYLSSSPSSLSLTTVEEGRNEEDVDDTASQKHFREPLLQRFFTTGLSRYLGHISYALYLAHGTVNAAVGQRWLGPALETWNHDERLAQAMLMYASGVSFPNTNSTTGTYSESELRHLLDKVNIDIDAEIAYESAIAEAKVRYGAQALCSTIVNTIVLFWVSDIFWRAVDKRAVTMTRRVWGWASKPSTATA